MKAPIPHLLLCYATLTQSLKVVTKRGSGKCIGSILCLLVLSSSGILVTLFLQKSEDLLPGAVCKHTTILLVVWSGLILFIIGHASGMFAV